jgi:phosphoserine phosphatase RsbU/P
MPTRSQPAVPATPMAAAVTGDERERLRRMERLSEDLLNVILPLGISLSVEKNTDRLLEKILLEAKAICSADAGTLYTRTRDNRLKFSIMRTDSLGLALGGTTGREITYKPLRLYCKETGLPNHSNVATHVALTGESVNVPDIYLATEFDFSATKVFDRRNGYRSMSTLTVPLKDSADQVIAVLQLLNALDASGGIVPFDDYQQLVVESLSSQAAVAFGNQLLRQREQELLRFERDLQIGRSIQAGFLPDRLPDVERWEIGARFLPAREVSGDFYDAFPLAAGHLGVVVADVCDKGVGAALFMALVRSLIRAYIQQRYAARTAAGETTDAVEALRESVNLTNSYIGQNHAQMNMFATLFSAVLDPATGRLVYVNCGHNSPIIFGGGRVKGRLSPTGPAVGLVPVVDFGVGETRMEPGDLLLAFTDGVTDARDAGGGFFGEPRMVAAIEGMAPARGLDQVLGRLQEELLGHIGVAAQYDDITMLALRRQG